MVNSILNMFGRSPIRPLQKHMEEACGCAELLLPFFEAVFSQDWSGATEQQQQIQALEHKADKLKQDLRLHLPKSLFLPVSRGDIISLLRRQDDIANRSKDIAGLIVGRKLVIPQPLQKQMLDYVKKVIAACDKANQAISELDELLETGFKGKEVTIVNDMVQHLGDIEYETDQIQIQLRQALHQLEPELNPIDVMFLYRVIELIGSVADHAEKVGEGLHILLAD